MNAAEMLARVVGEHRAWPDYLHGCRCGWEPESSSFCGDQHAAHVAAAQVAALEAEGLLTAPSEGDE